MKIAILVYVTSAISAVVGFMLAASFSARRIADLEAVLQEIAAREFDEELHDWLAGEED